MAAFDGFVDQEAHSLGFSEMVVETGSDSGLVKRAQAIDDLNYKVQSPETDGHCPDPENCHSCHQCMGHCGFLLGSGVELLSLFTEGKPSNYGDVLVSREQGSFFRPPILG